MSFNTSRHYDRMTIFTNNEIYEKTQFQLVQQMLQPYIFLSTSLCTTGTEHYIYLWNLRFLQFPLRIYTETIHGPIKILNVPTLTFPP